jgi:hypothetical protein
MLNFDSSKINRIYSKFENNSEIFSESVVQRVQAVSATIYTPLGVALNILLLALITFCKHDEIKAYKM